MANKKLYSIKKYMLMLTASATVVLIVTAKVLSLLGLSCRDTFVMLAFIFPECLFLVLYGFYKGLVMHYGLKGDEKIFFGGKF